MKLEKKDLIPLLLCSIVWGAYYVASQKLVGFTSVFTSGLGIRLLTMVFLLGIMWKKGELHELLKIQGIAGKLFLIGTFGFLLDLTAFIGLSMSSAASGAALLKCDIIMVNIMSMIIYKQRFSWKFWLCTGVMLIGVFMVMGIDFRTFQIGNPGNIFFLLSAFFVSCNAFVIKSVQHDKHNPASDNVIAFYNNFVTMLYFIAASIVMGSIGQVARFGTAAVFAALLCAAIGQTAVYVVYYHNLRRYPVWMVKTFLLLLPIVSTLISFVLFGETLVAEQFIGIFVILFGAMGVLLEQRNS